MSSPPSIEEIIADRQSAFSTNCIGLAALTLYFCDYIQSFEAEFSLMWGRRWTVGQKLFFLLRYLTAVDTIFGTCLDVLWWNDPAKLEPANIMFRVMVMDNVFALVTPYIQLAVFFLCIYCLLGSKRKWKITFIILFLLMATFSGTLMINHLVRMKMQLSDTSLFRVIGNYWVFARNFIVFLIGTVAIYTRYRESLRNANTDGKVSLISVVRRDGLFYYLGILATSAWACIFFTPGFPVEVRAVAFSGSIGRVLGTILACRMLINIRKTTINHETQASSLSALQFELQTRTRVKSSGTEQAFHSSSPGPVR